MDANLKRKILRAIRRTEMRRVLRAQRDYTARTTREYRRDAMRAEMGMLAESPSYEAMEQARWSTKH